MERPTGLLEAMTDRHLNRYPMYVPSYQRYDRPLTIKMLQKDQVPHFVVVQPHEEHHYQAAIGSLSTLLVLPEEVNNLMLTRNWIRDHAEAEGHARHWQFDDNIRIMYRHYKGQRLPVRAGVALAVCEDFTDRYTNVGIAGFNYSMFAPERRRFPPFRLNAHVYSATLINHEMPHRWRRKYNDDTDLCLQALSTGWCTIQLNAFLADKIATLTIKGGNFQQLYEDNGRLKMARSLERDWPGVVTVTRRFGRAQHKIAYEWKRFDTQLIPRDDLPERIGGADNYGMELQQVSMIRSEKLRQLIEDQ